MVGYRSDRDGRGSSRSFGDRDRGRRSFGDRGGFGGDRGGFGGRSRDFDRERKPLEMHKVTCDKCKKECEVPFKPTSSKPVFCSECFKLEGGDSRNRGNGSSGGISPEQFNQINTKLDKIIGFLEALEVEEDEDEEDSEEED